jgi:Sec-independent protein translocase protein TatA
VGFGMEILFMLVVGLLLLGPKRLPAVRGHVARAKAQFEKATQSFSAQLQTVLETEGRNNRADYSQETAGRQ